MVPDQAEQQRCLAFSLALAGELAGSGVQVTVVLPGRVSTKVFEIEGTDMTKMPPMTTPAHLVGAQPARNDLHPGTGRAVAAGPALGDSGQRSADCGNAA